MRPTSKNLFLSDYLADVIKIFFLFVSFIFMVLGTIAVSRWWERRQVIFLAWALFFALCGVAEAGAEIAANYGYNHG